MRLQPVPARGEGTPLRRTKGPYRFDFRSRYSLRAYPVDARFTEPSALFLRCVSRARASETRPIRALALWLQDRLSGEAQRPRRPPPSCYSLCFVVHGDSALGCDRVAPGCLTSRLFYGIESALGEAVSQIGLHACVDDEDAVGGCGRVAHSIRAPSRRTTRNFPSENSLILARIFIRYLFAWFGVSTG